MSKHPLDELEETYAAVGKAIAEWADVEAELCRLFTVALSPTATPHGGIQLFDPRPYRAAFYAIENWRSKLAAVDAVISFRLTQLSDVTDLIQCWKKIHQKARALSKRRNKLAHWNVQEVNMDGKGFRPKLVPAIYSPAYYGMTRQTGFTLHDLERMTEAFRLLRFKCNELTNALASHPELHSKFAALVARQMETDDHCQNQSALESLKHALSWPE